jgi:tetratricopeptide (TPR) repeat protein
MALGYSSKAIRIFEIDRKSIEWLAQAYGNRSDILNEMLRFTEAEYFLDSALKTQSQFLKKDDRDIATTYSKFSTLYLNRARNGERDNFKRLAYYYKGIDCVNGAIEIFEKKMLSSRYTSDIQNLCSAYNNLATIYEDLFQIENNKEYLDLHFYFDDKALSTAVKFFGDNHISTAYIYNNNGLNYLKSGNTEQAKIYIEKAYVIRKNSLPEDHPDIGVSLYNLARVYEEMRQKNHAITLLEESIEILEKVNHSALASVIRFYNEIR